MIKNNYSYLTLAIVLLLTSLALPCHAAQNSHALRLLEQLNSDHRNQRIAASKVIAYGGINDKTIYNRLKHLVEEGYMTGLDDKYHIDEISWHTKALATSGEENYRPTIQAVSNAGHKKLRRHGSNSLKALSNWAKWNPIINSKEYAVSGQTDKITRYLAMLKSEYYILKLQAAQGIDQNNLYNEKLLDTISEELLVHYQKINKRDKTEVQSMAWLCKVLGNSGDQKYKATLDNVARTAPHRKIKQHAKKALKHLS